MANPSERSRSAAWGVQWHRTVPAAFASDLSVITPKNDLTTSLLARWEPGDPWQPVERWVLWQLFPPSALPPDARHLAAQIWTELRGPHPRSTGHWCAVGWCQCRKKLNGWRGGAAKCINRQQWELYRETGRYARLWWIVQGTNGGHRYRLDQSEARLARLHTGRDDTPAPGELPYAPLDQRVLGAIRPYDRIERLKRFSTYGALHADELDPEERAVIEEANRALWSWLGDRMRQVWDETDRATRKEVAALPVPVGGYPEPDHEAAEEAFVTAAPF